MLKELILNNETALFSVVFTFLIIAVRIYFWQMEKREIRMFGHNQKPVTKKNKPTYKRTSYTDASKRTSYADAA